MDENLYRMEVIDVESFKIWFDSIQKNKPEWVEFLLNYKVSKKFWDRLKSFHDDENCQKWMIKVGGTRGELMCVRDKKTDFLRYYVKYSNSNSIPVFHYILSSEV